VAGESGGPLNKEKIVFGINNSVVFVEKNQVDDQTKGNSVRAVDWIGLEFYYFIAIDRCF
jgi:hypothetical protein